MRITPAFDVVVPTIGRPELSNLLDGLDAAGGPGPRRIVVVDDRPVADTPVHRRPPPPRLQPLIRVIRSGGRGPAAARNIGWRAGTSEWVVFLDDDVVPAPGWGLRLVEDLTAASGVTAGVQARIQVPLPTSRPPTDWERNVAGLEKARWITADMAYRRAALVAVGGFDERFPRAYREDADIALRCLDRGWRLERGRRTVVHPVRPSRMLGSTGRQAGNGDDPLMTVLHGRGWRRRSGVGPGRRPSHLLSTAALLGAVAGSDPGRRLSLLAWAALTAEFTWSRLAPGPRTMREVVDMTVTSIVIPPVAVWHWLRGWVTLPRRLGRREDNRSRLALDGPLEAVLFDRDGTLIVDQPYSGSPEGVIPMTGAGRLLDALRRRGVSVGIVTNQSGVGRGLLTESQVDEVNQRVDRLIGPFDQVAVCFHDPERGCDCRKPQPGLILESLAELGADPRRTVVIGDIGSDVEAARRAGVAHILVPTEKTLPGEVAAADVVAADLPAAWRRLLPYLPAAS